MSSLRAGIASIGFWANGLPGWNDAVAFARAGTLRKTPAPNLRRNCWRRTNAAAGRWRWRWRSRSPRARPPAAIRRRCRAYSPPPRRPRHHRLRRVHAGERTARAVADQVPQLGAQRRRRLLDDRQRLHRADHGDFRLTRASRRDCWKRCRCSPPGTGGAARGLRCVRDRTAGHGVASQGLLGAALVLVAEPPSAATRLRVTPVAASAPTAAGCAGTTVFRQRDPADAALFDALATGGDTALLHAGPGRALRVGVCAWLTPPPCSDATTSPW